MIYHSPLGPLSLRFADDQLIAVDWPPGDASGSDSTDPALLRCAASGLDDYFANHRQAFDLALAPRGTPFQQAVWQQLQAIPAGETRTYGQIATALGRPGAARAVGAAIGRNPLPIVIPCHRVLGAGNALTGFSGGLWRKQWLLQHEGVKFVGGEPSGVEIGNHVVLETLDSVLEV